MTTAHVAQVDPARNTTSTTLIEFLLDETGSMSSCLAGTLSGFNTFIDEQRNAPGSALLTLTKFDDNGLKTPYTDIDVSMAPALTDTTFVPGSMTNLRDAIGTRIQALADRLTSFTNEPNVLVVVLTDGDDNSSHHFSETSIQSLLRSYEGRGWTFVYLGPSGSSHTARRLGFQDGNIHEFETSRMHETMSHLSQSTTAYRAGTSKQFFAN